MSYDISLLDPVTKKVIEFDFIHQIRGGTYRVGGTNEAHLNATYNYSKYYYKLFGEEGIRALYGRTGADCISMLEGAIAKLKDDVNEDYWKATEGNAKQALCGLLAFAKLRPDGIFQGD